MYMVDVLLGSVITLLALLVGYSLGKYQTVVPTDVKKQINQIFHKVVPNSEIGAIPTLTQRELDILRDPRLKEEYEAMDKEFNKLQQQ